MATNTGYGIGWDMVKLYLVPVTHEWVNIFLHTPHMDLLLQTKTPRIKAFWYREQLS